MNAPGIGGRYWFEYHCWESDVSGDAAAWRRSHEQVTVISENLDVDGSSVNWPDSTSEERGEAGCPRVYKARWDDRFEWDVFEDELLDSQNQFERPDPPRGSVSQTRPTAGERLAELSLCDASWGPEDEGEVLENSGPGVERDPVPCLGNYLFRGDTVELVAFLSRAYRALLAQRCARGRTDSAFVCGLVACTLGTCWTASDHDAIGRLTNAGEALMRAIATLTLTVERLAELPACDGSHS